MDDIAIVIKEALPMCSRPATLQPILDALRDLGVETVEDMKLVQINDLAGVLKPIPARKLLAHIKGSSAMSAEIFMVAADQVVILENLANFSDALIGMFMSYYIFNIHYPAELGATMEFLQRCIFKINPDKGSKVERQDKKKANAVNPKVLTLINRIAEFEWSA